VRVLHLEWRCGGKEDLHPRLSGPAEAKTWPAARAAIALPSLAPVPKGTVNRTVLMHIWNASHVP